MGFSPLGFWPDFPPMFPLLIQNTPAMSTKQLPDRTRIVSFSLLCLSPSFRIWFQAVSDEIPGINTEFGIQIDRSSELGKYSFLFIFGSHLYKSFDVALPPTTGFRCYDRPSEYKTCIYTNFQFFSTSASRQSPLIIAV